MTHDATGLSVLGWLSEAGNSRQPSSGNKVWRGLLKVDRVRLLMLLIKQLMQRACLL